MRYEYLLPEAIGYRVSRVKCRVLDRHDLFCRGRRDHRRGCDDVVVHLDGGDSPCTLEAGHDGDHRYAFEC